MLYTKVGLVWFMVFNATFNNILVISWQSVLLVEEPEYPEKNTCTCIQGKNINNIKV